jgi:hypothetical protein
MVIHGRREQRDSAWFADSGSSIVRTLALGQTLATGTALQPRIAQQYDRSLECQGRCLCNSPGAGLQAGSTTLSTLELTMLGALVGIFDHLRLDRTRAILPAQTPTSCS